MHVVETKRPLYLKWAWLREGRPHRTPPLEECLKEWLSPRFQFLALYDGRRFLAIVGLEEVSSGVCEMHAWARKGCPPKALRRLLVECGIQKFHAGYTRLVTQTRYWNRAAKILAKSCGFRRQHLNYDGYWFSDLYLHEYVSGSWEPPSHLSA